MAADEVPDALAPTQEELVDVDMISECVAGFKRIQEFVTQKSGQKKDKLFFQVKCVDGNQERPPMTTIKAAQDLCLPNNSSGQMEHKTKTNVEDLRHHEEARAAPYKAQFVQAADPTVLQVTSTVGGDFQSVITVDSASANADGGSGTRGRMNLSRTVVEAETGMLNLVKLANATHSGPLSANDEGIANSLKRDIVSMEVPRKPRSKRSTTVVRLPGFTFQKLPDLLSIEDHPVELSDDEEAKPKETVDDSFEKSDTVDVHRKLKMRITPKRVVVPDVESQSLDDTDRCIYVKNPRRPKPTTSLQVVNELFQEEYSSMSTASETPKRKGRAKKAKMGRPRKARAQNAPIRATTKKRSLRSVIQTCLRKRRGGTKRQKLATEGSKPHRVQRRQKTVYTQYHHSMRQLKDDPLLRFDKDVWSCPTVTYLLTQKLIKVGDSVELLSEKADPLFHGWFTSRGILCSNCGMVHSCARFGACDNRSGTLDRLCVNDGITLSKLLDGHNIVDFQ